MAKVSAYLDPHLWGCSITFSAPAAMYRHQNWCNTSVKGNTFYNFDRSAAWLPKYRIPIWKILLRGIASSLDKGVYLIIKGCTLAKFAKFFRAPLLELKLFIFIFSVFSLFSIVTFKNQGCRSQSGTVGSSGWAHDILLSLLVRLLNNKRYLENIH